jgi:hypothetical protein
MYLRESESDARKGVDVRLLLALDGWGGRAEPMLEWRMEKKTYELSRQTPLLTQK